MAFAAQIQNLPPTPTPPTPTPTNLFVNQGAIGGPVGDIDYDPRFDERIAASVNTAPIFAVLKTALVSGAVRTAGANTRVSTDDDEDA